MGRQFLDATSCTCLPANCLQWKVKRRGDGAMLGLYAGQSAIVNIHKSGCTATYNAGTVDWRDMGDADCTSISTPHGPYAVRSSVQGMQIWVGLRGLGRVCVYVCVRVCARAHVLAHQIWVS